MTRHSRPRPKIAEFQLRRPIAGGEIVDAASARWLVNHAMIRAAGRQRIFKPDVVIAVMSSLPGGQRRSLLEAAALAGARTAYLLDAPLAAAMGAGIRLSGPNGHLVVDVGAGKTDIAALALEGTVSGRCLAGHGGMRLHACVDDHVRQAHGVTLDAATVEEVIASLARVGPHEERATRGHGRAVSTARQRLTITSTELNACLDAHVRPILAALDAVLADTPGRLMSDIQREGILLCGGGARLEGLDGAIAAATGIEVHRDSQPRAVRRPRDRLRPRQPRRPQARPHVHPRRAEAQSVASIPASTSSTRIWSMLARFGDPILEAGRRQRLDHAVSRTVGAATGAVGGTEQSDGGRVHRGGQLEQRGVAARPGGRSGRSPRRGSPGRSRRPGRSPPRGGRSWCAPRHSRSCARADQQDPGAVTLGEQVGEVCPAFGVPDGRRAAGAAWLSA